MSWKGRAELFIRAGFRFAVVDVLHDQLPSAPVDAPGAARGLLRPPVAGPVREALAAGYRFLSFGDAMIVRPDAGRERPA